jgi:Domain of unknown function (DUF4126)
MLYALSLAAGLAWASGLRLYLTVLLTGLLASFAIIRLPDSLSVLASPWMLGAACLFAIAEFLADKVPAVDSLWDALHTLIRIPAGALLAAGAAMHVEPSVTATAALAGAMIAGTAHLVKAGGRALINLAPEPPSNWVLSLAEDALAVIGLLLALFIPGLFLLFMLAFLAVAAYALPPLWHGVQLGFRGMAADMVPVRGRDVPRHVSGRLPPGRGRRD